MIVKGDRTKGKDLDLVDGMYVEVAGGGYGPVWSWVRSKAYRPLVVPTTQR